MFTCSFAWETARLLLFVRELISAFTLIDVLDGSLIKLALDVTAMFRPSYDFSIVWAWITDHTNFLFYSL